MPRTMPAGTAAEFAKHSRPDPVRLLDVVTVNGVSYYWADVQGVYPQRIAAGTATYSPWLKSAGPFRMSRSLRLDGGDIVLQNLSGNTIERDLLKQLRAGEFEGALAVFRRYDIFLAASLWEFHGTLAEASTDEAEAHFQMNQLFDTNLVDMPLETYSEKCSWLFKTPPCGSTGTAADCTQTVKACKDPSRANLFRFNGIITTQPHAVQARQYSQKSGPPQWGNRRSTM